MKRIHIVGCSPRSGTTLMTELMLTCFDIDLYDKHETSIHCLPKKNGNIYVTKNPQDILIIKPVLQLMRDLYVICLIRDPRDIIVSKHHLDKENFWCNLKFWKNYLPYIDKLLLHPRFLLVRYEDLARDPDRIQEILVEKIKFLKIKSKFSEFDKHAQPSRESLRALLGLRPISTDSIGRWRSYLPRIKEQIERHGSITEDLIRFGYETDNTWEKIMEDIEPEFCPSHFPEEKNIKRIRKVTRYKYIKAIITSIGHNRLLMKYKKMA